MKKFTVKKNISGLKKEFMIREAKKSDSFFLAKLHSDTLTSGFLASLRQNFLTNLYVFLVEKEKVWVYEENSEIKGFVSFSENSAGMMKRFLVSCPVCVLTLIGNSIVHPQNLKRFLETFLAPFKSKTAITDSVTSVNLPVAELLSISVSPNCQSSGIGQRLVKVLEDYLLQCHILQYKVVAGEELVGANKFYLKNGFILTTRIKIHGNKFSNVYLKKV